MRFACARNMSLKTKNAQLEGRIFAMLKAGVVGLHRGAGLVSMLAAQKDVSVTAGCDTDAERAENIKERMGLEAVYTDYDKFLAHDMDIVVVATPMPFHVQHSIAALESGRHVMCEVVIANSMDECEALVKAVKKSGKKYMLAENCCYWYFVEKWREMVTDGKIGKPIYAEAEYIHDTRSIMRDSKGNLTWRASRPPIHYITHSMGPLLSIMKDKCVSAVGMGTGVNVAPDLGVEDMEVGLFRTEKGAVIKVLRGSSIERKPAFHYYSIYGTSGCLESIRGTDRSVAYFKGDAGMTELPYGHNHPKAPDEAAGGGHGTCEYFMVKAFVDCIINDTKPPIDVYDGLDYSLPGFCAHISAQNGGKLVNIPDFR